MLLSFNQLPFLTLLYMSEAKIGTTGENLPHFMLMHAVLFQQLFYNISQPDKARDSHARPPVRPFDATPLRLGVSALGAWRFVAYCKLTQRSMQGSSQHALRSPR